jgi:hypothetical protein
LEASSTGGVCGLPFLSSIVVDRGALTTALSSGFTSSGRIFEICMMVLMTTIDITAITNNKLIARFVTASTYPGQKMSDASFDSDAAAMV